MPDNPLIIVFVVSIVLIAIYMAIEGVVLFHNIVVASIAKRTSNVRLPPKPEMPACAHHPKPAIEAHAGILAALATTKPHVLIIGHTGGGKSVLARAFVQHVIQHGAQVVALDPDAAPRHYPAAVHLISDDEQWSKAISAISELFSQRNDAYRAGTEAFDALWIVADECQELLAVDGALETIERVIRRGRKLNMHVLLSVQDSQVKTLGIEGKSALLANLTRCEVMRRGDDRVAVMDKREYDVPDFPTTYDGACATVLDLDSVQGAAVQRQWTEKHELAASILANDPDISAREFTRRLYGGDGTGQAYYLAKAIRRDIEANS